MPLVLKSLNLLACLTFPTRSLLQLSLINSKALCLTLLVIPKATFVEGHNISNNIILAQEVIHSMRRKKGKENWMAIKVDLENTYDRLS